MDSSAAFPADRARNFSATMTTLAGDVRSYVKDVLDQLLAGSTDYASLLPWNWAAAHPEAIRTYRVEERKQRSVRQAAQRAERRRARNRSSP